MAWIRASSRPTPHLASACSEVKATGPGPMSGSISARLACTWWRLCLVSHQP